MKERIALLSITSNIFLTLIKISAGFLSHSSAVLAEGFHSLTDVFSSFIGFLGIKISKKPADRKYPYGYFKFEVLAGFFITLILFITGIFIFYESYQKFLNPSRISLPKIALLVMAFSVLINEIMSRLKIYYGRKENSVALISDGFHSRVDVFSSLIVFLGLIFSQKFLFLDPILSFLIGFYIIKESLSLGKEAVDSLLDTSAPPEIEDKIREICRSENIQLADLRTQKRGSAFTANLEIELPKNLSVEEAEKVSENLRKRLMAKIENLVYLAIQIKSHQLESNFYQPAFGQGFGWQRRGKFRKEGERGEGKGPSDYCVCPKCGYKTEHKRGIPCRTLTCPNCHIPLQRE